MKKWGAAGILLTLAACAPRSTPRVDCKTACAVEYRVRVDPAFSDAEKREVWFGLYSWSRATGGTVCYRPQDQHGFNVVVIRGANQQALRPYIDHEEQYAGIYKDGTIVVAMDVGWHKLSSIIAHEAGHGLGLPHAPQASTLSVMHFKSGELVDNDLDASDRDAFYQYRCK